MPDEPTKPTTPPATPPPDPSKPFEQKSAQEQADEIAGRAVAAQAPPAPPPATQPPAEVEYTAENGIKFRGKDWQDIANQLGKSMVHGSAEITRLRKTVQAATGAATEAGEPAAFSQKRYFELMVSEKQDEGPLAAQRYALAHMFGIPEDRVVPAITQAVEESVDYSQRKVLNQFLAENQDFPGDQASVDALWQKMTDMDATVSAANFRTAHQACLQEGKYKPYVADQPGNGQALNTTTGYVPTPTPPLPLAHASAAAQPPAPTDLNRKAEEQMSAKDIAELVKELSARGVVQ